MAKRGRRRKTTLDTTAEGIGRTLGQLANRFEHWVNQRDALAADLRQVVGAGQRMLSELGSTAVRRVGGVGVGNGRKRRKGGRPKGSKMSAAARAKISAAQKARWAKQKRAG